MTPDERAADAYLQKSLQDLRAEIKRLLADNRRMVAENEGLRAKLRAIDKLNAENLADLDALISERGSRFQECERRVKAYFDSDPNEPAGRLILDLLRSLRKTKP